jgi:hypothetical protein
MGAAFTRIMIANSFGRKPVNGGMPPMDKSKSGSDRARTLWDVRLLGRSSAVSMFSVIISVNTGTRIVTYTAKYSIVSMEL